ASSPSSSRLRSRPRPTLFPYTTLFRSGLAPGRSEPYARPPGDRGGVCRCIPCFTADRARPVAATRTGIGCRRGGKGAGRRRQYRSEEHTSELQSRENLVCRLLLEKKKK